MARLSAADQRIMDTVMYCPPSPEAINEYEEDRRILWAFQVYFASTPEGQEEGRWLNEPAWMWIKAGSPPKIGIGAHPLRQVTFAAFEREWRRRAATGEPMTMIAPQKPKFRFGARVG